MLRRCRLLPPRLCPGVLHKFAHSLHRTQHVRRLEASSVSDSLGMNKKRDRECFSTFSAQLGGARVILLLLSTRPFHLCLFRVQTGGTCVLRTDEIFFHNLHNEGNWQVVWGASWQSYLGLYHLRFDSRCGFCLSFSPHHSTV